MANRQRGAELRRSAYTDERRKRIAALKAELLAEPEPTAEQLAQVNKALRSIARRVSQTTEGG